MTGQFFQIDRRSWRKACDVGLNAAVAYLVLATGTGKDNRTTSWSANAMEQRTGISRARACASIRVLEEAGLIQSKRGGSRPQYFLTPADKVPGIGGHAEPEWIWLPNTLVNGAADEVPPIERLRRLGDVRPLKLLVELYHEQLLADNGGLHWRLIRQSFRRERIGEAGHFAFWSFTEDTDALWWDGPFEAFRTGKTGKKGRDLASEDVWAAWQALIASGLIECVEHLIEADSNEGEILHPCPINTGSKIEQELGQTARDFTLSIAGPTTQSMLNGGEDIIAVSDAFPNIQMVGIYRLRYRPHTAATAAWISHDEKWKDWINGYRREIGNPHSTDLLVRSPNLQHQGISKEIKVGQRD